MVKVVTVAEMRAIEKEADAHGFTYMQMMETAGLGLAEVVQSLPLFQEERRVIGLVGPGNNGGDTLVALSSLAGSGWITVAYLVRQRAATDPLIQHAATAGTQVISREQDPDFSLLDEALENSSILLDGILGTGFQLPLREDISSLLAHIKEFQPLPRVVAVDCPSGMDCDSGEAAMECLPADMTVTMAAVKAGMLKFPAFDLVGDLEVVGIGVPVDLPAWQQVRTEMVTPGWVAAHLPPRPRSAHKGTFGTVLIAAGSVNYTGAVYLAGKAAYRAGTGLVRLAVPAPLHAVLAGQLPEATWLLLPHESGVIAAGASDVLLQELENVSAVLTGPGLGLENTTLEFLRHFLQAKQQKRSRGGMGFMAANQVSASERNDTLPPFVLDADGLKLLAKIPGWPALLEKTAVLTPHPGEMSVLTGKPVIEIQADRQEIARQYSALWGHVVVLKGAVTVVAAPDGACSLIPIATPALARAGTGDVLAGIIAGLRAQGMEAYQAACAGAWIHARAGLIAAEETGSPASVLASDVLECIPQVFQELQFLS